MGTEKQKVLPPRLGGFTGVRFPAVGGRRSQPPQGVNYSKMHWTGIMRRSAGREKLTVTERNRRYVFNGVPRGEGWGVRESALLSLVEGNNNSAKCRLVIDSRVFVHNGANCTTNHITRCLTLV